MSRVFEALQQLNMGVVREGERDRDLDSDSSSSLVTTLAGDVGQLDAVCEFSLPSVPSSRLVALSEPHTLASEKFRGLVARLRQVRSRRNGNRILVASAVRGDGKSMMSANLAITLASQGERTLLIDGDLHKPTLHGAMGIRERRGFTDWAIEANSVVDYMWRERSMPLWLLPAGTAVDQPLTHIQSPSTSELLVKVGSWFDWVIIDSPPIVPLADSMVWSTLCDWLLLVVREGATPKRALSKTIEAIDSTKLFAVILNDAVSTESKYYRQYYRSSAEPDVVVTGK